ncbi:hypothetical protein [Streptomyces sp. ISL-86]|nr:hypothetical protein [Streptomyces sp. ISL-86]
MDLGYDRLVALRKRSAVWRLLTASLQDSSSTAAPLAVAVRWNQ